MPLYVDADGTLIKSNLLIESALRLLKQSPASLFSMLRWLFTGGKARLKHEIAERVDLDPASLPYREEIVALCREAREQGRKVVLATGSDTKYAQAVAEHLGLFDATIGTTLATNLTGKRKLEAILVECPARNFVYAGNEAQDLHIWEHASGAVVCGDDRLMRRAARVSTVHNHLPPAAGRVGVWLRAIRIHQWAKNVLVFLPFVPLVATLGPADWLLGAVGFLCFGLCASSVYLTNDLLDLDADRVHERKRRRPIPAGDMSLSGAIWLAGLLLLASFTLAAALLPAPFLGVLLGYWLLTTAYSFDLKRRVNVDILSLALLYTMRILAGSAVLMVQPSFWMLAFSMFLFFSLAAAKRQVELDALARKGGGRAAGRGYVVEDIPVLRAQGIAAGQLAVLVLALYINDSAALHFTRPELLWGACPCLLLWINRVWFKAGRGELNEDPVLFALRDGFSQAAALAAAVCVALAAA